MMMPGRLSNKVMLPIGPQWGNGGGVAACMNWYSNVTPKPPKAPPRETSTYRHGTTRKVLMKGDHGTAEVLDNYNGLDGERYVHTSPWADKVGLTRVDGKLKLTNARGITDGYVDTYTEDPFYLENARADSFLTFDEYGRKDDVLRTSRPTYRPPTPNRKYNSTQAHTKAIAEAHQSMSRTAPVRPSTPKKYGFMGPPPNRRTTTPQKNYSRVSIPSNVNSSTEEIYKYTEREFIIEDIDDDKSGMKERTELYTTRPKVQNYHTGDVASSKRPRAITHYDLNGRPHTAGDRSHVRESQKYMATPTPRFVNSIGGVETVTATPIPMPAVWQTAESDWPSKSKAMTSRPKTAGARDFTFKLEPTPPTGGKRLNGYSTRFPEASFKDNAAENVMIHVDCSKLASAARPTTVTVRLHGVDHNSGKIKDSNITPFGTN